MTGTGPGRAALGLLLLLFGLAAGIAYEALDWRAEPHAQLVAPAKSDVAPAVQTAAVAPNRVTAWRNEILSRPLFSQNRRPVERAAQTASGLSRLTGIIFTGTRWVAIFAGPSGGHPIVAEEGSRIGAYDVRTISDTGVTVAGPEGTTVVKPAFGAPPPSGANTTAAARPQTAPRVTAAPQRP